MDKFWKTLTPDLQATLLETHTSKKKSSSPEPCNETLQVDFKKISVFDKSYETGRMLIINKCWVVCSDRRSCSSCNPNSQPKPKQLQKTSTIGIS